MPENPLSHVEGCMSPKIFGLNIKPTKASITSGCTCSVQTYGIYEEWSNNACRGYVIKAMENCGFKSNDIRQVLTELYEVFDFCAVEEAAHYYEHWQS